MGTAVQGCPPEPPDPCKNLLQEMLEFVANLQKRWNDLKINAGNLPLTKPETPDPRYGFRSLTGERQQYSDRQKGLQNRLNKWDTDKCGPPPAIAEEWALKKFPTPDPEPTGGALKMAGTAGAGISVGYALYRIVRMLPSLFPPLWETIPINAEVP